MQVEEVSLVDRAANKRKFLIVKRQEKTMATGAPITAAGNGQFTSAAPAAPAAAAPPAPAAAPTSAAPAADGGVTKDVVKLTGDAKTALAEAVAQVEQLIMSAKSQIGSAQEVASPEEQSIDDLLDSLSKAADLLEDSAWALIGVDPEGDDGFSQPGGDHQSPPPAPAPDNMASMTMGKRLELFKARRVISLADVTKAVRATVEKIGAKMTKERQSRLRNAMKLLGGVLKEVMTSKAGAFPPAPGAGAPPPGAPKKKPPIDSPGVAAPTVPPATAKNADELQSQISDLQKRLKSKTEEAAALRKSTPGSNAIPVDGNPPPITGPGFSWPMDLNDEIEDAKSPLRF
jgi:hypothetical protein